MTVQPVLLADEIPAPGIDQNARKTAFNETRRAGKTVF